MAGIDPERNPGSIRLAAALGFKVLLEPGYMPEGIDPSRVARDSDPPRVVT
jgi:hypothetical protein